MARDFIFKIREGQALPAADPSGYRVLLDEETGLFKLLASDGEIINSPAESRLAELETTVEALPPTPTTTVVNISSAQILAMGTSPIELLPAPGAGMYYDIEEVLVEYTYGTQAYVPVTTHFNIITDTASQRAIDNTLIASTENAIGFFKDYGKVGYKLNKAVFLGTQGNSNPTDGNGTLRVIMTYTVKTFGV